MGGSEVTSSGATETFIAQCLGAPCPENPDAMSAEARLLRTVAAKLDAHAHAQAICERDLVLAEADAAVADVLRWSGYAGRARRVFLRTMPGANLADEGLVYRAATLDVRVQGRLAAARETRDLACAQLARAQEAVEATGVPAVRGG